MTGLADALIQCGVRYGEPEAARLAGRWMQLISQEAYRASAELAAEKGAFPLVRRAGAADAAKYSGFTGRYPHGDCAARFAQWFTDLDRADGDDFPAGRQRLERDRAGVRFPPQAAHARRGRRDARGGDRGLCRAVVPVAERRGRTAAAGLRAGGRSDAARASGDAGRPAGACRQFHFKDHQLSCRHAVRGVRADLSGRLRDGPQGLHDLPAECDHRRGADLCLRLGGARAGRAGHRRPDRTWQRLRVAAQDSQDGSFKGAAGCRSCCRRLARPARSST